MPISINISASRGAAILGLSKWKTPVQSWLEIMESREPGFCEKHNYELPVFEYNAAMRWGHAFENSIIELAENKIGIEIVEREQLYTKDFLTCHIDGRYHIGDVLHEGKTTNFRYYRENFGEPGTDRVPVEYQIQCQHQMICTGAEKVILSVLVFPRMVTDFEEIGWEIVPYNNDYDIQKIIDGKVSCVSPIAWARTLNEMGYFHTYEIIANRDLQLLMIEKYTDFWNNHVLTGIPPEAKSYDDIRALVREPIGTIIANDEIVRLMSEFKNIGSEISTTGPLAKRREQIKVDVLKYMASAGAVLDDESKDKFILRDNTGKKIASYGNNKNGIFSFR